jgi:hypothetical protein
LSRYRIGIDPGVATGYATWDRIERRLVTVCSMPIHEAMDEVRGTHRAGLLHSVVFEDAHQRKWFGGADARQARSGAGIREGVGSVKRDCTIWRDFLTAQGITFQAIKPAAGSTKWDADTFARMTGWTAQTNNHGRDAALLVIGR